MERDFEDEEGVVEEDLVLGGDEDVVAESGLCWDAARGALDSSSSITRLILRTEGVYGIFAVQYTLCLSCRRQSVYPRDHP